MVASKLLAELKEDCIATMPLCDYERKLGKQLRDDFHAAVGGVTELPPLPVASFGGGWDKFVHVAIVDTTPPADQMGAPADLRSAHGVVVGSVAKDLACPNNSLVNTTRCAADVHTYLGMPLYDFADPSKQGTDGRGGTFGTKGMVARAVFDALQTWKNDLLNNTPNKDLRLILNLSIGWEAENGACVDPAGKDPPGQAVKDVLDYAACHGALIIAAAGNDTAQALPPAGLMCPALFEATTMPNSTRCSELGVTFDPFPGKNYGIYAPVGTYAPLVHAVHGVDYAGNPLLSRRIAQSRIAALGLAATTYATELGTDVAADDMPLPPHTGTSIAAAVVTGTAAAVWAQRQELSAPEIMAILYNTGRELADNQHAPIEDPAVRVHRVSQCAALNNVLAVPLSCSTDALLVANPHFNTNVWTEINSAACGLNVASAPSIPMPPPTFRDMYSSGMDKPWALPQPLRPPNPWDFVGTNGVFNFVHAQFDPGFPMALCDMTLVIENPAMGETVQFPLVAIGVCSTMTEKQLFKFSANDYYIPPESRAWLTYRYSSNPNDPSSFRSVNQQILIDLP